jgi:hypothetical protein
MRKGAQPTQRHRRGCRGGHGLIIAYQLTGRCGTCVFSPGSWCSRRLARCRPRSRWNVPAHRHVSGRTGALVHFCPLLELANLHHRLCTDRLHLQMNFSLRALRIVLSGLLKHLYPPPCLLQHLAGVRKFVFQCCQVRTRPRDAEPVRRSLEAALAAQTD